MFDRHAVNYLAQNLMRIVLYPKLLKRDDTFPARMVEKHFVFVCLWIVLQLNMHFTTTTTRNNDRAQRLLRKIHKKLQ